MRLCHNCQLTQLAKKKMAKLRVLIVGASIAGPTAAYWFARAGASVTVIERFPHLRPGGQNIDIRNVGVTTMRRMPGMEEAVRANAALIQGMSFVRGDGRPYGTIYPTGNPEQQSLISEYEIARGDLSRILVDMTKEDENVRYVFGEQVASIMYEKGEDGPVKVEFSGSLPAAEFDLVVASDGAFSRTRAMAFGGRVRDHVEPTGCWAAYFSAPRGSFERDAIGEAFNAPDGRFIAIGPSSPTTSLFCLLGMATSAQSPHLLKYREAHSRGDEAVRTFLADHYRGAGWRTDEAIEHMLKAQDFYTTEVAQVKLPGLYRNRVVLVGDAGYAPGPTGTGTSLAIAGAYILAGEISKHQGDLASGLKAYETRMRPITKDLQQMSSFVLLVMAPQTKLGIWLRNTIFSIVCWSGIIEFVQKFLGSGFQSSEKHRLEDYAFEVVEPQN